MYAEKQLVVSVHQCRSSTAGASAASAAGPSGFSPPDRACTHPSCRWTVCARHVMGNLPSPDAGRARRLPWLRPGAFMWTSDADRCADMPCLAPRDEAPTIEPAAMEP